MSITKRELVKRGYAIIGIADYEFDLEPQELQIGLEELDSMMASWSGEGVNVFYPLPDSPSDSSLDEITQVYDFAWSGIAQNLAVRLGPIFKRAISRDIKVRAKNDKDNIVKKINSLRQFSYPNTLPRGAGAKAWRGRQNRFFTETNCDCDVDC